MQANQIKSLALVMGLAFGTSAVAAVSADQAKRLGRCGKGWKQQQNDSCLERRYHVAPGGL